jgi:hypothetical protein
MHANAWNLKSNKERLTILERTHAQKKHLMNILTAKSRLDTHATSKLRHSPTAPINLLQKRAIEESNYSMIRRIIKIGKVKPPTRTDGDLGEVVRNLKTYSSLNRSMRLKEI